MPDDNLSGSLDLPFAEQIEFFRKKLNLPTKRWDDIKKAEHDRFFIVAGAEKADLLADLHEAVLKAERSGTTLETFRKDFRKIVEERGWHGWTGEGTKAGENWRTRVIYETNLRTSYAAGRYAQLTDPDLLARRPYWKYVHADGVQNPRPQHLAWNGLVLRHDHPFWKTNYPPNGWGCGCTVTAVRAPKEGDKTEPPPGWDKINEKTGELPGIDRGWGYAPGASVADELRRIVESKVASLPPDFGIPFYELAAKNAEVALERSFGQWVDNVLAAGVTRNQTAVIGAMTKMELDFWRQETGNFPESAALAVEDRLMVGKKAGRHEGKGDALTSDEWKRAAALMRHANRDAYYDTVRKNIVYLLTLSKSAKNKAKLAIEVDFIAKGSKQKMNLARAAFKQDPQVFNDGRRYKKIE
ncbi:MAG: hypothetical protein LBL48_06935 [Azoarcus sp.]|jgi:hypothetical protein|nr:hypothetical protein [Azoarcus sp.]